MVFSVISLFFWLLAVPFCIGMILAYFVSPERRSPGFVLLSGYFGMWALFELAAVPAVLWVEYSNFKIASAVFTVLAILCAVLGIFLWYRNLDRDEGGLLGGHQENDIRAINRMRQKRRLWEWFRDPHVERCFMWLLFFVLLGFQLYKAAAFTSFDGDDAYYVVESLIAQEADVMYRILPYTGGSTGLDVRHAMAVFPMWVAFVSVRAGIHATIVSHIVMPLVLIPLTYLLYYEIGRSLFKGKQELPVFMIIMALFQIFGNVSIYTNETFFLTRTWQGKAVAGSLVFPALIWVFLHIYDKDVRKKQTDAGIWILLVCINMTVGVCSSIAVFLACILTAFAAFCLAVAERDWKLLFKMGAACIPNAVYMAVYVFVAYGHLL